MELAEFPTHGSLDVRTWLRNIKTVHSSRTLGPTESIMHSTSDATCGVEFELGFPNLIFAYETENNELVTGMCTSPSWFGIRAIVSYLETGQDHEISAFYCGNKFHRDAGGEEIIPCNEWKDQLLNEIFEPLWGISSETE